MSAIAREAGALLMQYFHQGIKIEYKGDADLVTAADRASEALIRERVASSFRRMMCWVKSRGSTIRAAITAGTSIRSTAPRISRTDIRYFACRWRWNIDVAKSGQRIAGVVYDPTRDEMFTAEQGRGAQLNGKAIHVSKAAQLKECLLATGFPSQKRHKNPNIYFYHQITLRTHGVRRAGSAALDLCNVASGRFDGFWEFNLNPWDTAAGVLIVEEAGGKVTRFDGSAFQIDSRETLASNGLVHDGSGA